ncbi:uncharacterized protein LOC130955486 isoform X3 [Arachis stenosperma]|uniref:uncharacterized protein LOC130955486 isoform X3 n=1 Tax=Arachis stenosperma TaxID=217475 RepID=UPI0025AC4F4B|nr:uncharacterized protein LOC130955486 isoform X3 [Arachis stenosperma]XP_057738325.1 uncharacterized protein LOC130955486 isoform X3 [Arachis stenosperma]
MFFVHCFLSTLRIFLYMVNFYLPRSFVGYVLAYFYWIFLSFPSLLTLSSSNFTTIGVKPRSSNALPSTSHRSYFREILDLDSEPLRAFTLRSAARCHHHRSQSRGARAIRRGNEAGGVSKTSGSLLCQLRHHLSLPVTGSFLFYPPLVETRTLEEVKEVLYYAFQTNTSLTWIMLDNMVLSLPNGDVDISMLKETVQLVNEKFEIELQLGWLVITKFRKKDTLLK